MTTFSQYLSSTLVAEDVEQDIAKLTSELSLIDTQINQRTQPLLQRKAQLQKLLAVKQNQRGSQAKQQDQQAKQQAVKPESANAQALGPTQPR